MINLNNYLKKMFNYFDTFLNIHLLFVVLPLSLSFHSYYQVLFIKIKYNSKLSISAEINRGIRQGCPLSPTLFNIYMNEIITKWENKEKPGIRISRRKQLSTLLFADDQVIISDTEDNLQKETFRLNKIAIDYGLTISKHKTKTMAFKGPDPIRSKIVIDSKIIEQVNTFNYLGNLISYEGEKDISNKLNNFTKITGVINNVFKPKRTLKNKN